MIKLQPGDIFCSANPMCLGRAIVFVEKVHSSDNQAEYSHVGAITHGKMVDEQEILQWAEKAFREGISLEEAVSYEALWTNKRRGFYEAYKGKKVLIGRHENMTPEAYVKGWGAVKNLEGKIYAGHRLALFLALPFLAKYINLGLGVCSEIGGKLIAGSEIIEGFYWKGKNPDHIADMIHRWKGWHVVSEAVLE
ncbi:MAG: hypothetical protein JXI32_01895 [Deltaproteobacteria bacterium]|nr:hypothetical protein [Deltaproteobacteria bacterium]